MRTIVPSFRARRRFGAELRLSSPWRRAAGFWRVAGSAAVSLSLSISFSVVASCTPSKGTIGAIIVQDSDSGRLFLREVPASLAAGQANLKPGDEILLIDGLDVRRMDAQQINAALTGDVDSPVKLTLLRNEQVLRVTLRRTEAHRLVKNPEKSPASAP